MNEWNVLKEGEPIKEKKNAKKNQLGTEEKANEIKSYVY